MFAWLHVCFVAEATLVYRIFLLSLPVERLNQREGVNVLFGIKEKLIQKSLCVS